jgi:spore maturation protein CgeB
MTVMAKYDKSPTHPLPHNFIRAGRIDPSIFNVFDDTQDVDLWLEVDAGFFLDPKPKKGIVAHVATDPHALNYDRQRQLADFFFNMQTPYMKNGDIYLPYAYDPKVHYPEESEKEYDVCMVGLHYELRTQLVNRLVAEGLNVHYSIGEIFDEYREVYNKSRVAINWSSRLDMNARVWELAAMGIPAVQNTVPDMKTFFVPGEHYLEFTDVDGAVKQVLWALDNYDEAQDMANAAYRKVQPHTWDARIAQILDRVGLKSADNKIV